MNTDMTLAKPRKTLARNRKPWHRTPNETSKGYHAFCHYMARSLINRSVFRAFKDHLVDCGASYRKEISEVTHAPISWLKWCRHNNWVERAELHDEHVELAAQKRWRQTLIKERDQQYRMAVAVRTKVAQRLSSMDLDEIPATALASLLKVSSEMALTALGHDKKQIAEIELKPSGPMIIEHHFSARPPEVKQTEEIPEGVYEVIDSREDDRIE